MLQLVTDHENKKHFKKLKTKVDLGKGGHKL